MRTTVAIAAQPVPDINPERRSRIAEVSCQCFTQPPRLLSAILDPRPPETKPAGRRRGLTARANACFDSEISGGPMDRIAKLLEQLDREAYVADPAIGTSLHLALELRK